MFSEAQSKATDVRPKVTDVRPFQLMLHNLCMKIHFWSTNESGFTIPQSFDSVSIIWPFLASVVVAISFFINYFLHKSKRLKLSDFIR